MGVSASICSAYDTDCGFWLIELGELKLGELLDTPPPGLDEAIAISKVTLLILSDFSFF